MKRATERVAAAPLLASPSDPCVLRYLANLRDLLAGQTDLTPDVTAGITTGPGNQGTQNTAHLIGQAGTSADRFSIPRQMHFGAGSGVSRP